MDIKDEPYPWKNTLHIFIEVKKYLGMSKGRLLRSYYFWVQFCPWIAANVKHTHTGEIFSPNTLDKSHIFSLYQRGLHIFLLRHSHTSSLTLSHTYSHTSQSHQGHYSTMQTECSIPTTLCCLVRSDTIPPHKRNRKPGRKGFTNQFCGPLYKHATSMHLTPKNIRLYTPNIQTLVISMF